MYLRTVRRGDGTDLPAICAAIFDAAKDSRFTLSVTPEVDNSYGWVIRIRNVRLKHSKSYCGNHPGPCRFGTWRKHRILPYLEGADWVGFSDFINDVLDSRGVSADVWSRREGLIFLRRGRLRRWRFEAIETRGFLHWEEGEPSRDFVDGITCEVPETEYLAGTPGIACWRLEDETAPLSILREEHANH